MDKKQVISRMSQESYDRLQELSKKYGVSSSALLVMLVNERWLQEQGETVKVEEKPEISENAQISGGGGRKRHKSRK